MKQDVYSFDEKKHIHTLNGKPLTGVTTVLGIISKGDGLIQWSANEAVKYLQEHPGKFEEAKTAWKTARDSAGSRGTDVHALVEDIVNEAIKSGGYIKEARSEVKQVRNFEDWAIKNNVKFLASERNIYSKEFWIGGIVDLIGEINGDVYVMDIKTSKQVYPTNFWQCAAYQKCLQEMGEYPKIKGFKVIRLGKDGSFEVVDNYAFDDNIEGFKAALTVYRKLNLIS